MKNESTVQDEIRIGISQLGGTVWRNNSGVLNDKNGRPVRFGLGNDSARVNKAIKSADLIGIMPVVITPDMVGQTLGVFVAIECKAENWAYNDNNAHSRAQKNFLDHVQSKGGIAGFCNTSSGLINLLSCV